MSRVGWLWGWNSASKFQKDDSTKRLVGISPNLRHDDGEKAVVSARAAHPRSPLNQQEEP